jgi:hypothetical protein
LSYSRIDEIPISHLTQAENCWKVTLIRQSHLTNRSAAENGFISSCDGPLKFKKKSGQASSLPARII